MEKYKMILFFGIMMLLLSACSEKTISVVFWNGWPVFLHEDMSYKNTVVHTNYKNHDNSDQLFAYTARLYPLDGDFDKRNRESWLSICNEAGLIPYDYPYEGVFNGIYDFCFIATYNQTESLQGKTFCNFAIEIDYVMDPRYVDKIIKLEIDPYSVNGDYYVSKRALEIFPDVYEIPQVVVMIPDPRGK